MATTDQSWNFMSPEAKDRLLGVLQKEMDDTFALVADPERWQAPTACEHWQVRDVIGHLVDTTEGYLPAFDLARTGGAAPEPHGLRVMAELVDTNARALRKVPRDELLERLRDDARRMMAVFADLSDDDWTGLMVPHSYMGPIPAMFYPEFQLVDYAVHAWDIREGIGEPHGLWGDSADFLAPVIFILWQATADVSGVDEPYSVGITTSGRNGGDVRVDISPEGMQFAPGDVSDCPAVIEFDPATFVLTGYARMNGGTVRGDRELAGRFRSLFFPI
ncbi:MAG TPA: maleylpyruvate isomerase family mycothiol-dependent enzyme [Acidimicrobiales bacterium]